MKLISSRNGQIFFSFHYDRISHLTLSRGGRKTVIFMNLAVSNRQDLLHYINNS